MALPFTEEAFFEVMRAYNEGVRPAQYALTAVALACVALVTVRSPFASRLICGGLALLWTWAALAYHFSYFREINPAAPWFAGLFLAGACFIAWEGLAHGRLSFDRESPRRSMGALLVLYALVGYPVLGALLGHRYPESPTFGMPCPTDIFTLGMLLFLRRPFARWVLAAPLAWAAIGSQAAVLFGVYEDLGLLVAAAATLLPSPARPLRESGPA